MAFCGMPVESPSAESITTMASGQASRINGNAAIHAHDGHQDVQQDQVGLQRRDSGHPLRAVGGLGHHAELSGALEGTFDEKDEVLAVVDHNDSQRGGSGGGR